MLELLQIRCEYTPNPLGIDVPWPRFSWVFAPCSARGQAQSAFQVQVASTREGLLANRTDVWDSGKVFSSAPRVEYGGPALASRQRCFWRVRAWDAQDVAGSFSQPAWFEMGLLAAADWEARWIGFPAGWSGRAVYFRKAFELSKPVRQARIYASGLGYFEVHLNGHKLGDAVLDPGVTDTTKRVLYNTYDVSEDLRSGANLMAAVVGNGWHGAPKLLLQLEVVYEDGLTDCFASWKDWSSWQVCTGPILENSIYGGETYDARLEKPGWDAPNGENTFDRLHGWQTAMAVEAPTGRMAAQMAEPIRVVQTLRPQNMTRPAPGIWVYDFGQNFAGWVRLRLSGQAGERVTLKFAETLYADGRANQENLRSAAALDTYILKGGAEETWEPAFTYHGFRYVQMEGFPGEPRLDTLQGRVVRSAVDARSSFACSSALLNRIDQMVRWTETSNLHSIPTDCPQRDERMGWMNDLAARSEEMVYNFDVARFLTKFLQDIADAQDPVTGAIPDTVPYHWGGRPADPVSVAYLFMAWLVYQHNGDTRILKEHFDGFRVWVDFLTTQTENLVVQYSYYGDWAPPVSESEGGSAISLRTPGKLMSTAYYYYSAWLLAQMARVIGRDAEAGAYSHLAEQICQAYNASFWDETSGGYGSNNQACNAISLWMGLVPEDKKPRVVANLVRDVLDLHDGHLTTGNLCSKYLLEVLTRAGRGDVAYHVATRETYPSWGYMLANGATTCWERWELMTGGGMNSHNHPMLASVGSWLYKGLAGITADASAPGFAGFEVQPLVPADLTFVRASIETPCGPVGVAWERNEHQFRLHLEIPVGSRARVHLPEAWCKAGAQITESGSLMWKDGNLVKLPDGINHAAQDGACVTLMAGSGAYDFVCIVEK